MCAKENIRLYRVWHTEKKTCSKFDKKENEEVYASSVKEAKKVVHDKFPNHRITSAWLIEK